MAVILLSIYGALDALFWKWLHQNHLGASTKGLVFWTRIHIIEFLSILHEFTHAHACTHSETPAHKYFYALRGMRASMRMHTPTPTPEDYRRNHNIYAINTFSVFW